MSTTQELTEIEQPPIVEKAVLVRLVLPDDRDEEVEESVEEMKRLAWTAGADVACVVVQRRPKPCPATLVGKGKTEEILRVCDELEADMVILDSDLSPAQGANLEDVLGRKVVDRTQLILDIFAQRARTNEGKHQVELAQLQYMLPRLAGRGSVMRQQGGIGVRGPGEQKLEVDRRIIRHRIGRLKTELEEIKKHRRVQRRRRIEAGLGTVALVGYTNAGKSSLLNALTGAEAFVEDKLFATLDPTTRRCALPSGRDIVLTDTVGFVRQLPHSLVAAFRATLEEVNEADLLLLVADAAHPAVEDHIRAVYVVLDEIEVEGDRPILTVLNKTDIAEPRRVAQLIRGPGRSVAVSARTGNGLDGLLEEVDRLLGKRRRRIRLRIPQQEARVVSWLHDHAHVRSQQYLDNAVIMDVEVDSEYEGRLARYVE